VLALLEAEENALRRIWQLAADFFAPEPGSGAFTDEALRFPHGQEARAIGPPGGRELRRVAAQCRGALDVRPGEVAVKWRHVARWHQLGRSRRWSRSSQKGQRR